MRIAVYVIWAAFWLYWLISAFGNKHGTRTNRTRVAAIVMIALAVLVVRLLRGDSLRVHSPILQAVGLVLFLCGIALAVWARVHLGRNWGTPMSQKDEPELITSGPYHLVRHPIYSGILLATLGTALITNGDWLIVFGLMAVYFLYSAGVEEKLLESSFPSTYPSYRAHTKRLIPFVI